MFKIVKKLSVISLMKHHGTGNPNESQKTQNSSFETILQPTEKTFPAPNKTTDDEYQESLESFLFIKDQKKPE